MIRFLLVYHRVFNIITVKTTRLFTIVRDYLKIPVKPLFCHTFIAIKRVKKTGVQFLVHPVGSIVVAYGICQLSRQSAQKSKTKNDQLASVASNPFVTVPILEL